ncbi:hypothetical protein VCB_003559 [Vibrio cholerae TMA 21]|nr:hypothetical protein VCB_003559 [Vibrio cholerae TMA 21]
MHISDTKKRAQAPTAPPKAIKPNIANDMPIPLSTN